jgi:hypothetical protein
MASALLLERPCWPSCVEPQPWHSVSASLEQQTSGDQHPGSQQTAAPPPGAHLRPAPPPPPALAQCQPQLRTRLPGAQGCLHCIACVDLLTHAHTAGRGRRWGASLPRPRRSCRQIPRRAVCRASPAGLACLPSLPPACLHAPDMPPAAIAPCRARALSPAPAAHAAPRRPSDPPSQHGQRRPLERTPRLYPASP